MSDAGTGSVVGKSVRDSNPAGLLVAEAEQVMPEVEGRPQLAVAEEVVVKRKARRVVHVGAAASKAAGRARSEAKLATEREREESGKPAMSFTLVRRDVPTKPLKLTEGEKEFQREWEKWSRQKALDAGMSFTLVGDLQRSTVPLELEQVKAQLAEVKARAAELVRRRSEAEAAKAEAERGSELEAAKIVTSDRRRPTWSAIMNAKRELAKRTPEATEAERLEWARLDREFTEEAAAEERERVKREAEWQRVQAEKNAAQQLAAARGVEAGDEEEIEVVQRCWNPRGLAALDRLKQRYARERLDREAAKKAKVEAEIEAARAAEIEAEAEERRRRISLQLQRERLREIIERGCQRAKSRQSLTAVPLDISTPPAADRSQLIHEGSDVTFSLSKWEGDLGVPRTGGDLEAGHDSGKCSGIIQSAKRWLTGVWMKVCCWFSS